MADNNVNLNEYNKTDEEKLYSPCDDCEYKIKGFVQKQRRKADEYRAFCGAIAV